MYDFHKTKNEVNEHEFSHKLFRKGQKEKLIEIKRKEPSKTKKNRMKKEQREKELQLERINYEKINYLEKKILVYENVLEKVVQNNFKFQINTKEYWEQLLKLRNQQNSEYQQLFEEIKKILLQNKQSFLQTKEKILPLANEPHNFNSPDNLSDYYPLITEKEQDILSQKDWQTEKKDFADLQNIILEPYLPQNQENCLAIDTLLSAIEKINGQKFQEKRQYQIEKISNLLNISFHENQQFLHNIQLQMFNQKEIALLSAKNQFGSVDQMEEENENFNNKKKKSKLQKYFAKIKAIKIHQCQYQEEQKLQYELQQQEQFEEQFQFEEEKSNNWQNCKECLDKIKFENTDNFFEFNNP